MSDDDNDHHQHALGVVGNRLNLQVPSLEGDKPSVAFGGDSGYRNLALALGICWEPLPEFDAGWKEGDLIKPELQEKYDSGRLLVRRPEPVHILAVAHLDLTPVKAYDSEVKITTFHSSLLKEFTDGMDKKFVDRLKDLRAEFTAPSSPFMATTVDKVTQRLTAENKLFHRLDFALEHVSEYDSEHNLTRQLAKAILHPSMLWLWLFPGEMNMENQPDIIKFADKRKWKSKFERAQEQMQKQNQAPIDYSKPKPVTPIVWFMAGFMKGILMFFDVALFGRPRTCRLLARKYGNDNEDLAAITNQLHKTASDEYTLRKLRSVEAVKIFARATNQMELFYWITTHLRHEGLPEADRDVSDSIALMLERFCSGTRDKAYTKPERERIAQFQEKWQQDGESWKSRHGRPDVRVDLFTAQRFKADGCEGAIDDYLRRERIRLRDELKAVRQRKKSAPATDEELEQEAEDELFERREKEIKAKSANALAAKRTTNFEDLMLARDKAKKQLQANKRAEYAPFIPQKPTSKADQEGLEALVMDLEKEEEQERQQQQQRQQPPVFFQPKSLGDADFASFLRRKRAESAADTTVHVDLSRLKPSSKPTPNARSDVIILDNDEEDESDNESEPKKSAPKAKGVKEKRKAPAPKSSKRKAPDGKDRTKESKKAPKAKRAKKSEWGDVEDDILSDSDEDSLDGFAKSVCGSGSTGFSNPFDLLKSPSHTRSSKWSGATATKTGTRNKGGGDGGATAAITGVTTSERLGIWQ